MLHVTGIVTYMILRLYACHVHVAMFHLSLTVDKFNPYIWRIRGINVDVQNKLA